MSFFTTDEAEHLAATTARAAWLCRMEFKSATVFRWAGNTVLEAGSETWKPTFGQVAIDGMGWSGEPVSRQVTLSLSGVDDEILPLAIAETNEADQQPIYLYLQLFDADWQNVGGLIPSAVGLMQPPRVDRTVATEDEGAVQSITLPFENLFYNRSRPANGRYTDTDQKRRFPDDRMCDFVSSLVFKTLKWPKFS